MILRTLICTSKKCRVEGNAVKNNDRAKIMVVLKIRGNEICSDRLLHELV